MYIVEDVMLWEGQASISYYSRLVDAMNLFKQIVNDYTDKGKDYMNDDRSIGVYEISDEVDPATNANRVYALVESTGYQCDPQYKARVVKYGKWDAVPETYKEWIKHQKWIELVEHENGT